MNEYTPDEETVRSHYAESVIETRTTSHDEAETEFNRFIARTKADAWDEAIDEARVRLMMMGTDEDELKEANPHR